MLVQFIVKLGLGDGQGFVVCVEMEFYKKNLDVFDLFIFFIDGICFELKFGFIDEEIENCLYLFYKNIVYYMKQGKYLVEFCIQEYKVWFYLDVQLEIYKISFYSLCDNFMGILVKDGE